MSIQEQIDKYINEQADAKRSDMEVLHQMIIGLFPEVKLWFLNGKDDNDKIVSNPNIGYGSLLMEYTNGTTKEFYQIGMSANQTGISIYIMGIEDKAFLAQTYGKDLGKANVTGYCIRFKKLKDINIDVLKAALVKGIAITDAP